MATYNPKYAVSIIHEDTKYNVTEAVTKLMRRENDGEIAQLLSLTLANIKVNGQYLADFFTVRDRVYVYANDGEKNEEVFRGFIWEKTNVHKTNKDVSFTCYDNLIFFQESEEYQYFSAGYSTKSICSTLCNKWGVTLKYNHTSITHPKLPLRGNLADIFLTDLLEEVQKKTGSKGVLKSIKDTVHIDTVGSNELVYKLYSGDDGNATETQSTETMYGMVTKVVILGKEDDDERAAVEDTIKGNTGLYGTLQKIITVSSGTTLAEAREEANQIIKDSGKPKKNFYVTAVDIPWIRKGDRIIVNAGDMNGYYIVTSITHYGTDKTMTLEAEAA